MRQSPNTINMHRHAVVERRMPFDSCSECFVKQCAASESQHKYCCDECRVYRHVLFAN